MSKIILDGLDARKKLEQGMTKASDYVATTIGPKGLNVIMDKGFGTPEIVNDGITVLKEIEFDNPFENMGVELLKESAQKTNDIAGDGTTSTCILTSAILREGFKSVASGANGIFVKKGIDNAVNEVVEYLKKTAIPVDNEIEQIATISSNSPEVGKFIADAMDKVGKDGVITLEDGKANETYVDVVQGMQFDKGMISPYFATSIDTPNEVTMEDATIVIVNENLKAIQDFVPVLEKAMSKGKPIVIIADDFSQELITTMVLNKVRGILDVVAVKSPGFGDNKKAMLNDIAVFTGGTVITEETGMKLKDATTDMFGSAKKVTVTKDNFTIIEGNGEREKIDERISQLRKEFDTTTSEYERGKLDERIAKLSGGVAVLYVGANTETEQKEMKLRIEDALNATKSAIAEGIVAGGGIALANASKVLTETKFDNDDMRTGYNIIKNALIAPLRNIAKNSGLNAELIVSNILTPTKNMGENWGVNASNGEYVDMIKEGIIDPVKVTRVAIQNASSVAGMILTTNVAIAIKPEKTDTHDDNCNCGMGM